MNEAETKIVKRYIEMMEEQQFAYHKEAQDHSISEVIRRDAVINHSTCEVITGTPQYKALKALVEEPQKPEKQTHKLKEMEKKAKRLQEQIEDMQRSNDLNDSFRYMAEGLRKHTKPTPSKKED